MRDRFPHYIRPAGSTRIPRRHLILDVETRPEQTDQGEEHHWRLACTELIVSHNQRGWSDPKPLTHTRPWELWAEVNHQARDGHRLIVWCHNLAFDLRASQALPFLVALGFECEQIALDALASWGRFTRGPQTIIFTDLMAWLPTSLAQVAQDQGMAQVPNPGPDAPDGAWGARCRQDVRITRRAVMDLLDFVSEQSLGPWRPTGSGQSHSAWRHRFLTHPPLVHDQLAVLELERKSAWTGRCEVWRWGQIDHGPLTEYDLDLAYCQIGAEAAVPQSLVGVVPAGDVDRLLAQGDDVALLARVRVNTDVEVVPAQVGQHIRWPTGTFETVVWDPELRLLQDYANSIEYLEVFAYRTAPALKAACRWIAGQLRDPGAGLSPVRRRALKHWARALVGRCALRYSEWETWRYAETEDVALGLVELRAEGVIREEIQIGREVKWLMDRDEAPDSLPQIPGWIMSECRRRLWVLMLRAGLENVAYVDTDSLLVTPEGAARLDNLPAGPDAWPMKVKGTYHSGRILAPRLLELDGQRRAAGIPRGAAPTPDGSLAGGVFVSLRESLMAGLSDRVALMERSYRLEGIDRRRRHLPGGRTRPFSCSVDQPDGDAGQGDAHAQGDVEQVAA